MGKLPTCTGKELIQVLERQGWENRRQTGSHVILTRPGSVLTLSVPLHAPLAKGTLRALIAKAGLTADELRDLL
jgi:predicted RNA binding protein YcfA (HicA-like mRNA interferase family)